MFPLKRLQIIFLLLSSYIAFSQPPPQFILDSLAGQIVRNARLNQQERPFFTTDKAVYKVGENIWLRAFLLQSNAQKISTRSKTLIVDLVNENDSIIRQILFNAGAQQLTGKLVTDIFLPSGFYWFRAYTPEVNDAGGKVYSKPVYILNPVLPEEKKERSSPGQSVAQTDIPQIKFFPEGGNIITGAPSVVTFYAADGASQAMAVTGVIKDNRDSIITKFNADPSGIGQFEYFPHRARKYTAIVEHNGKQFSFALPSPDFFAGQLSIRNSSLGLKKIRVLLEDSIYRKDYVTYLVGISKDSVCFASIGRGNYEVNISEHQFPRGIATLYLFDENLKPLSERSFFVRNGYPELSVSTDKSVYRKREKGSLSISVFDKNNVPLPASVSVAITDARWLESQPVESITSQYFRQGNEQLMNAWMLSASETLSDSLIDILMMAKSPTYKLNATRSNKSMGREDSLLYIRGQLLNATGQPLTNQVITLLAQGQSMFVETATTNAEGKFTFPLTEYADSTRFKFQIGKDNAKAQNLKVIIDQPPLPQPEQVSNKHRFVIPSSFINSLLRAETNEIVMKNDDTAIIKGKNNTALQEYIDKKRVSPSSHIIPKTAFSKGGEGTVRNAVLGVPGMSLLKGFLVIRGHSSQNDPSALSEPLVVMNGLTMQLPEGDISTGSPVLNFLNSLNTDDIDFIEVLKGPEGATFGVRGGKGVLLINTSGLTEDGPDNNGSVKSYYARGYQRPYLFQSPNYDIREQKNAQHTDLRSTLLWNGNILTNEKGKAELTFFTNDVPGNYIVTIRGITERGDIIYKSIGFTIK